MFIVRAPKIFPVGFNLLKHFMDEQTKEKIVVFGSELMYMYSVLYQSIDICMLLCTFITQFVVTSYNVFHAQLSFC